MARDRRILDTSVLIGAWQRGRGRGPLPSDLDVVRQWAEQLISLYRSDAIVTPVAIEYIAGVRSSEELRTALAFLDCFRVIDAANVSPDDWLEARRLAERVPRDGRPRHLGDCLIRALARRLRHDVVSLDLAFPR
jgi:predicted nucleic acid-binding protein